MGSLAGHATIHLMHWPGPLSPLVGALLVAACGAPADGPDLLITHESAVSLSSETSCAWPYHLRISNQGSQSAYAVVIVASDDSGAIDQHLRIQPGPAAGEAFIAVVCRSDPTALPWCVEARVQQFNEADLPDLNPADNRWCASLAAG